MENPPCKKRERKAGTAYPVLTIAEKKTKEGKKK